MLNTYINILWCVSQTQKKKRYYVYYCIGATCFDSYRIILKPFQEFRDDSIRIETCYPNTIINITTFFFLCLTDTSQYISICVEHFVMANINFVSSQAKTINLYHNTSFKLLKCCPNIYFNKQCLVKQVIRKYANLKIKNVSVWDPTAHFKHCYVRICILEGPEVDSTRIETCCPNTIMNIITFCCVWLIHHCIFIYVLNTLGWQTLILYLVKLKPSTSITILVPSY